MGLLKESEERFVKQIVVDCKGVAEHEIRKLEKYLEDELWDFQTEVVRI